MLGLDWMSQVAIAHQHPQWLTAMRIVYRSLAWQPAIALTIVAFSGQIDRCWKLVWAAVLTLAITSVLFALFPAIGALRHYGVQPSYLPLLELEGGWRFGPVIEAIKAGERTIDERMFAGLVSFPSFHAASAVLIMWLTWKSPARWFFFPFNVAVLLSTPLVGAHYFVDVIAGVGVATASIAVAAGWRISWPAAPTLPLTALRR
jgi:membrane-associated phospholipid phosphatase